MRKDITAVIFDFDGTIGDTASLIVNTMQLTLQELGLPSRSREECLTTIGLPLAKCFTAILPISDQEGERCAAVYRDIFERDAAAAGIHAFPGVPETLQALHDKGLTLTIATSRQRPSLEAFLQQLDLLRFFSYIVTVNDVERAKPAPDMVLQTLSHLNVQPSQTLVVGDAAYDILMGNSAGATTCAVTYGNGTREELLAAQPDHVVDSFAEILSLMDF